MTQPAPAAVWKERRSEPRKRAEQYHSAEFIIEGLEANYQFRIWDTASSSMCVIIKETSEILPLLRVGATLKVKYYSAHSAYPSEALTTVIRHITLDDQGRFRGHYLVGLEIQQEANQVMVPGKGRGSDGSAA